MVLIGLERRSSTAAVEEKDLFALPAGIHWPGGSRLAAMLGPGMLYADYPDKMRSHRTGPKGAQQMRSHPAIDSRLPPLQTQELHKHTGLRTRTGFLDICKENRDVSPSTAVDTSLALQNSVMRDLRCCRRVHASQDLISGNQAQLS